MKFDPKAAQPVTEAQMIGIIDRIGANYPPEYSAILKGIAKQETEFRNIQGKKNNQDHGVFQINEVNLKGGKLNPYDPVAATEFAFKLLDDNLKATGSIEDAITAYNAGAGKVNKFKNGKAELNAIQKKYAAEVMAKTNLYKPGMFSIDKINSVAQRFGYNGNADFVAMSGGKKNLVAGNVIDLPTIAPPQANPSPPQMAQIKPEADMPTLDPFMDPMNGQYVRDVDQAVAALQQQKPLYSDQQEMRLANAFGREPESINETIGLPEGLMNDIRMAVEAA